MCDYKNIFDECFKKHREDDEWDYKRKLKIKTKKEKYELLKDVLAFSNYGGGYILIGVDNDGKTLYDIGREEKIDEASIGDIISDNLGFNIKTKLSYFDYKFNDELITVGMIHIMPSNKILVCPKDFCDEKNKNVLTKNIVYSRANTRSISVGSSEINEIVERCSRMCGEISGEKPKVYSDEYNGLDEFYAAMDDKYVLTHEKVSVEIRRILALSDLTKPQFLDLVGIEKLRFEKILKGEIFPQIDELIRISIGFKEDIRVFFRNTIFGSLAAWEKEEIRYNLINKMDSITKYMEVENKNSFFGQIFLDLAKNINDFYLLINEGENAFRNEEDDVFEYGRQIEKKILNAYRIIPTNIKKEFIDKLKHQYYKVLEISNYKEVKKLNLEYNEKLAKDLGASFHSLRIILESIKEIKVLDDGDFEIIYYFWDELISKKIYGRSYDDNNNQLTFYNVILAF